MNFVDYFLKNYVMLFEVFGLLLILSISVHISKSLRWYTRLVCLLLVLASVINNLELWTHTFDTLNPWRVVLTIMKYIIFPVVMMIMIQILATKNKDFALKWKIIMAIPLIISIPLYVTSQWTHLVFYFLPENVYRGGPLFFIPYVVFGFYLVIFMIQNITYLRNSSNKYRLIVFFITGGALACVLLYMIIDDNEDYTPIFTSSLLFYYLLIYIKMANVDPLTNLLNRQSYYHDIYENSGKISAVVSVDMNNLKIFNDKYGHAKGDEALKAVSDVLKEQSKNHALAYRVGGDEFCLFYFGAKEEDIESYISYMREELAQTEYSCAFGYVMTKDFANIKEAIKEADKRMYTNKYLMKIDADKQKFE